MAEPEGDDGWTVIHSYTRAQALSDGVLIDVSDTAKEAGIKFPVALTSAVWGNYVAVPPGVECQDESGRLWDVLYMFRFAVSTSKAATDTIRYRLLVRNDNCEAREIELKAVCGPGDEGEPIITIMLPEED